MVTTGLNIPQRAIAESSKLNLQSGSWPGSTRNMSYSSSPSRSFYFSPSKKSTRCARSKKDQQLSPQTGNPQMTFLMFRLSFFNLIVDVGVPTCWQTERLLASTLSTVFCFHSILLSIYSSLLSFSSFLL